MGELVALDVWAVRTEPQDRFLDEEDELPTALEEVALPADPVGDGLGYVGFESTLRPW